MIDDHGYDGNHINKPIIKFASGFELLHSFSQNPEPLNLENLKKLLLNHRANLL